MSTGTGTLIWHECMIKYTKLGVLARWLKMQMVRGVLGKRNCDCKLFLAFQSLFAADINGDGNIDLVSFERKSGGGVSFC